jgi:RHS repeat-associated protein
LRFQSAEFDVETGLYYRRARYYDPGPGRFISEDPIGLAGGINAYVYANNNPVNATDPYGLQCRDPEPAHGGMMQEVVVCGDRWPFSIDRDVGWTTNFANPNARNGGLSASGAAAVLFGVGNILGKWDTHADPACVAEAAASNFAETNEGLGLAGSGAVSFAGTAAALHKTGSSSALWRTAVFLGEKAHSTSRPQFDYYPGWKGPQYRANVLGRAVVGGRGFAASAGTHTLHAAAVQLALQSGIALGSVAAGLAACNK